MSSDVILITRNGWGDVWSGSRDQIAYHPLCQPSDAVVASHFDLLRKYNSLEYRRLFEQYGDDQTLDEYDRILESSEGLRPHQMRERLEPVAEKLLSRLCDMARPLPDDPEEIVRLAVKDRESVIKENEMTEQTKKTDDAATTKKADSKPKREKPFSDTAKIKLGKDKEGNSYGPKNNPKRTGSKSADRFSKYKEGMTVKQYSDAVGGDASAFGDLKWDVAHGFVIVEDF